MRKFFIAIFSFGVIIILLNFIPVQEDSYTVEHKGIFYLDGDNEINYTRLSFYAIFLLSTCICLYYILSMMKPMISNKRKSENKQTGDFGNEGNDKTQLSMQPTDTEIKFKDSYIQPSKSVTNSQSTSRLNVSRHFFSLVRQKFHGIENYAQSILKTTLLLSALFSLSEIFWYYQKFNNDIFNEYSDAYETNYCYLLFMGSSILFRWLGIIKYFQKKEDWILYFIVGQIMAIAQVFSWGLGLEIQIFLQRSSYFYFNICLLIILLAVSNWNFNNFENKRTNTLLFVLMIVTLGYFLLKTATHCITIFIFPDKALIVILFILLYLLGVFSIIKLYYNYEEGYKIAIFVICTDVIAQIFYFIKTILNFSEMNE